MCTAISYKTKDNYFGRNMDYEYSYEEKVTITPRNYRFNFRRVMPIEKHYAMIGIAYIVNDYPLYYDATNEKGLSMAGLNFPENAVYYAEAENKDNIAPFEFIPWILSQCATVEEAKKLLERINLVNINFSDKLPLSPLHWIIADRESAITVETLKDGMKIYDNPVGVLTNNPPFDYHMTNLCNYMHLTKESPENTMAPNLSLKPYSRGMGGMGLPGDLSSASRFVRATFVKHNSVCGDSEDESVSQFFHILTSVEQQRGCVKMGENLYEITIYSSCCNTDKGIYYYRTYNNFAITAVNMHETDLEAMELTAYPLSSEPKYYRPSCDIV